MILCVNIGNSTISLGLYVENQWKIKWRLSTAASRTADEYDMLIHAYMSRAGVKPHDVKALVLASVVPRLTETFSLLSRQMFELDPFFITPHVRTGLNFGTENLNELGADLIANAVAGYRLANSVHRGGKTSSTLGVGNVAGTSETTGGNPAIIVDFGTALSFTIVDLSGCLRGVIISPGLSASRNSLAGDTAQLPRVKLNSPPRVIGTNTVHSIQSGIIFGFTGLVEYMIAQINAEMGARATVIATGGQHQIIAAHTSCFDFLEPWLNLHGIQHVYSLNQ